MNPSSVASQPLHGHNRKPDTRLDDMAVEPVTQRVIDPAIRLRRRCVPGNDVDGFQFERLLLVHGCSGALSALKDLAHTPDGSAESAIP